MKRKKNLKVYNDEINENSKIVDTDIEVKDGKSSKLKEYDLFSKEKTKDRKMMKNMKKKKKKKKNTKSLKNTILILLMLGLIGIFSLIVVFCIYVILTAPDVSEEKLYKNNSTVLLDKNGNEFKRLGTENREKITYDEIPEVLIDAIVSTEDARFFQHDGVDLARFTKAAIGQLLGHSDAGGGSTLTMQVSKIVITTSERHGIRGIIRKFTDVYVSVFKLEKKYTKEQILEFYVNIPGLGAGSYGVEQASKVYFGKSVKSLNLAEAALIAGLFQAPSAYNPYAYPEKAEQRRNQVLNLMYRHGYITESERDAAKSIPIKSMLKGQNASLSKYVGFIDTVVEEVIQRTKTKENEKGDDPYLVPMIIHTTMDPTKQDVINDIYNGEFKKYGQKYSWKNDVAQAGIAVIDVKDGSIAAIGTRRNNQTERSLNLATSARRQPGSTAKPVLDYGPAIEYLGWGTGQTVIDEKYKYNNGGYIKNFDYKYKGVLTIKQALAQSRNIPALLTFHQTTNEQKVEFATALGWKPEMSNGNILESCSMGGFTGVTPLESAAAYATFARGGTYIEPYSFTKIEYQDRDEVLEVKPKKRIAMSEQTAYLVTMILKYAVTGGYVGAGSVSGTDIAGKTGTATVSAADKKKLGVKDDMIQDSWTVAYSPDYAIATWYGYETNTKKYHLTGTEGGAARKAITKALVKGIMKKNSRFKKPSGIVTAKIELETDPVQLASEYTPKELIATEYFKKKDAPTEVSKRFSKLADPSNIQYSKTGIGVNISWTAAPTPDAIKEEYLTEYFNSSSIYKFWASKFVEDRKEYNKNNLGNFGYNIYVTNLSGETTYLGFTTDTNYQINIPLEDGYKVTVKSAYSKFSANQSDGINAAISSVSNSEPNEPDITTPITQPTTTTTKPIDTSFTVEYIGPSCSIAEYNKFSNDFRDKLRVISNNENITNNSSVAITCNATDENGQDKSCNNLPNGKDYTLLFTIKYYNTTKNKQVTIKKSC